MIEAPLEGLTFQLSEKPPEHGIVIVDTSDMFCALEGDASQKRSLEKMCHLLGYQTRHMHNAGNDAHVEFKFSIKISGYLSAYSFCFLYNVTL